MNGQRHYLWRAVDQDDNVLDILVQSRRNKHAAKKFFGKLLKGLIPFRLNSYANQGMIHRKKLCISPYRLSLKCSTSCKTACAMSAIPR
jgi:hypothetical protein